MTIGHTILVVVLCLIGCTIGSYLYHGLGLVIASRRWRSRWRVAAAEGRRWRRDPGHPCGHDVYARNRERGRHHA